MGSDSLRQLLCYILWLTLSKGRKDKSQRHTFSLDQTTNTTASTAKLRDMVGRAWFLSYTENGLGLENWSWKTTPEFIVQLPWWKAA